MTRDRGHFDQPAASIARALGGHRSRDGFLVRCPVPGHGRGNGDRHPPLLIKDGETRVLVHCFAGCSVRDVLDALGCRDSSTGGIRRDAFVLRAVDVARREEPDIEAVRIWRSATVIEGTVAALYLQYCRGLTPPFPSTRDSNRQRLTCDLVCSCRDWSRPFSRRMGDFRQCRLRFFGLTAAARPTSNNRDGQPRVWPRRPHRIEHQQSRCP
jgi:hypothetical protein